MAIECQCGMGMLVTYVADGYQVAVRRGSATYAVVSNRLVYSQRFPLPPTPLFSFVFSPSPAVNVLFMLLHVYIFFYIQ